MKITDIRLESYIWPYEVPISNGKHTYTHAGRQFVFIDTDEGITGIGIVGGVKVHPRLYKFLNPYSNITNRKYLAKIRLITNEFGTLYGNPN